jgi:hypothetical protein
MGVPFTSVQQSTAGVFAGMLADGHPTEFDSFVSEEASAEIPFGVMVKQGTADNGALKLTATSNKLVGLVVHTHGYAKDNELGSTGLKPKTTLKVLTKGRAWVKVEEAVTPSSAVKVRAVASGGEVAGAFRDTADSTDCIDCSAFMRYVTSAAADGFAMVDIDMSGRNDAVADT